ncbi:MAG: EpsG family protein [Clostridia bacterium]|nr:EpsG family protein [Clostridia bacterium]
MNWLYGAFFASIVLALLAGSKIRFVLSSSKNTRTNQDESALKSKKKNYNSFFTLLFFGLLLFVVACREGFIDTPDYRFMYEQIGPHIHRAFNNTVPRVEQGYLFITALLNMVSTDSQFLLLVFGAATTVCFAVVLLKYTENATFSLILYVCNMWVACMNGLRQIFVASLISLFGALWISEKSNVRKTVGFIALCLLLSTVHTSAILCIPFYFMAKGKFMNKWVIGSTVCTVVLLMFPALYETVFRFLTSGLSYAEMLDSEATMGASRLLISGAPVVLFLIYHYSKPDREYDESVSWMLNLMVFGFLFSLLSLKMVYFSRMRMYFSIFITITLPYVVNRMFDKKNRNLVIFFISLLYIAVFIYQLGAYGEEVTDFRLFFEQF